MTTIIPAAFVLLLVTYLCVALVAFCQRHGGLFWRSLPLAAAGGLVAALWVPTRLMQPWVLFLLPLFAAVCIQAWRGPAWQERSLRMLSAFWLLWGSLSVVLNHLQA